MWSYYGESHKGFAVGFEKTKLFRDTQCQFAYIIYQEDLPLLGLFDDVHTHFQKLIGTKSNIWSHEDEYRLTKINAADQVITLAPDTITEVTCGCQMPLSEKNQIIEYIKKELPHARVF